MKQQRTKQDLILIALYQMAYSGEMKVQALTKELEKYLKENYTLKDEKSWDFESMVCDTLYGNNGNVEEFLECVEEHAKRKK